MSVYGACCIAIASETFPTSIQTVKENSNIFRPPEEIKLQRSRILLPSLKNWFTGRGERLSLFTCKRVYSFYFSKLRSQRKSQ